MTTKPTRLVLFGATGDLMAKKIIPSLYMLHLEKKLPENMEIIGFSRRAYTLTDFRNHIKEIIEKFDSDAKNLAAFLKMFSFISSQFDDEEGYLRLKKELGNPKTNNLLFYLSVAPNFFGVISNNLKKIDVVKSTNVKVLVEKPVGSSEKEAMEIDKTLKKTFNEDQIYRTDHYLQKRMVRNIFAFRFFNSIFEPSWNNKFIESVEISANEDFGVETRGSFYDPLGALRDMAQSHLLQLLSLIAMEKPTNLSADAIRKERAKIVSKLKRFTPKDIKNNTFRSQYKGYRKIENVDPKSMTETYFRVKAFIDSPRWKGVPFFLESGKRLKETITQITITFKKSAKETFLDVATKPNQIIFVTKPKAEISVNFNLIKENKDEDISMKFESIDRNKQYVEGYKQIFLDVINNDRTWFVSNDEVLAAWRFVDPIVKGWQKNLVKLNVYEPNK